MKTLKELGISTAPWIVANDDGITSYVYSDGGNGDEVSQTCYASEDARLIAAAPELYDALREAVVESCVAYCGEHPIVCKKKDGECFVQKWRNALAKAAGEEAGK